MNKATKQINEFVEAAAEISEGNGKCIGCDKPTNSGPLCQSCEDNLNALGEVMDKNNLSFSRITLEVGHDINQR